LESQKQPHRILTCIPDFKSSAAFALRLSAICVRKNMKPVASLTISPKREKRGKQQKVVM
jgi:hypothetical protein